MKDFRLTRQKADRANGQITRKTDAVVAAGDTEKTSLQRVTKKKKGFVVILTSNKSSIITARGDDVGGGRVKRPKCPFLRQG